MCLALFTNNILVLFTMDPRNNNIWSYLLPVRMFPRIIVDRVLTGMHYTQYVRTMYDIYEEGQP